MRLFEPETRKMPSVWVAEVGEGWMTGARGTGRISQPVVPIDAEDSAECERVCTSLRRRRDGTRPRRTRFLEHHAALCNNDGDVAVDVLVAVTAMHKRIRISPRVGERGMRSSG